MPTDLNGKLALCERLRSMGYAQRKRIRMYGEEFDLTSNPVPNGNGFSVGVVSTKSGSARELLIPLSILQMITKDPAKRPGPRTAT